MYISVVIPAFNEEKRIPSTLKKIRDYLEKQKYTWEVLIVNDGSRDKTAEVVGGLIKDWSGFKLIDNKINSGKGAVVKQGMLQVKGDWRLFMDADGSTDIVQLEKLLSFIDTNDIVIGSRYLNTDSIKIKQPLSRRIASRFGNFLVRSLLGINMVDTQCGFKLFSKRAAEEIFRLQTIERWGFDMEIIAIALRRGFKIKEVPVDWYDATSSTVGRTDAWKTFKELMVIRKNIVSGKYS